MAARTTRRDILKAGGVFAGAAALGIPAVRTARAATTLRMAWWGSDARHKATMEALTLFHKKTGITVTPEIASFDDQFNKLAVQVAGGNAPDVFQMSGQYILEYASRNALLDLQKYSPDPIDLNGWDDKVKNYGVINGVMAGIPIGVDAYTVLYDQTVLDELKIPMPGKSWTWDEFAAFATQVTKAKGGGYFGTTDSGQRYEALETFVRQRGKTLFNKEGTAPGFEKTDLIDWFTFWDKLRKAGVATSAEVQAAAQSEEQQPIVHGKAATYFTTSSQFVNQQGLTKHVLNLHTLPFSADGKSGSFIRPGLFISAYAKTKHPKESAQLIQFLLNDHDAAAILKTARGVPPSPAIRQQLKADLSPEDQKGFAYIDTITQISTQSNILTPPGGTDVTDLLARIYQAIAFGKTSIQEGVDQFFKQAPSMLGT